MGCCESLNEKWKNKFNQKKSSPPLIPENHNSNNSNNFINNNVNNYNTKTPMPDDMYLTTVTYQDLYQNLESIRQKELERHNELRSKHKVCPLTLNNELNEKAQKFAEKLLSMNKNVSSQDKFHGENLGENVYNCNMWMMTLQYTAGTATDDWYSECKNYDFYTGKSKNGQKTDNFTQVVWKNTDQCGFGYAMDEGKCFVVANYFPAGNCPGQYTNNVFE